MGIFFFAFLFCLFFIATKTWQIIQNNIFDFLIIQCHIFKLHIKIISTKLCFFPHVFLRKFYLSNGDKVEGLPELKVYQFWRSL